MGEGGEEDEEEEGEERRSHYRGLPCCPMVQASKVVR